MAGLLAADSAGEPEMLVAGLLAADSVEESKRPAAFVPEESALRELMLVVAGLEPEVQRGSPR